MSKAKYIVWIDHEGNPAVISSVRDDLTPELAEALKADFAKAMTQKPVLFGPEWEVRVLP